MKALCWALQYVKRKVDGQKLIVWIDPESSYLRIRNHNVLVEKNLLDGCISRFLDWIMEKKIGEHVEARYLAGEHNKSADTLSC